MQEQNFDRINEILTNIRIVWMIYPEMRLGQLLENFVFNSNTMFYQEDDITNEKLKKVWKAHIQNN